MALIRVLYSFSEVNQPLLGTSESTTSSRNLWASFSDSVSDYVPLRSSARSNDEEAHVALSHWERFLAFCLCQLGAALCFLIAFLTIPLLALKPRKFAVAFSMGSLLFMLGYVCRQAREVSCMLNSYTSFALLQGPINHLKHLFSAERWPFTISYFGSLFLTLFFALIVSASDRSTSQSMLIGDWFSQRKAYFGTLVCCIIQLISLVSYLTAYFPCVLALLFEPKNLACQAESAS